MKSFENTSLMKNESDAIKAAIKMLKSKFSVKKVILFGSKARGDHDEHPEAIISIRKHRIFNLY